MSQENDQSAADLGRINADLVRGLKRCSGIVRDYRSRLIAANSNDAPLMHGGHRDQDDGERTG